MVTMASGTFSEIDIMEVIDLDKITKHASKISANYRPVGR